MLLVVAFTVIPPGTQPANAVEAASAVSATARTVGADLIGISRGVREASGRSGPSLGPRRGAHNGESVALQTALGVAEIPGMNPSRRMGLALLVAAPLVLQACAASAPRTHA